MKKHILGLGLFSFIVVTAGFIYSMFSFANVEEVFVIKNIEPYESYSMPNSCWKMKQATRRTNVGKLTVKQAVFDVQTKQFNWELATPDIDEPIALHFFSKDGEGTRYIMTELVNNKFSHNGYLKFSNSYNWLNKRKSYENLYVFAEFEYNSTKHGGKFDPEFDAAKATAITVDYGE